MLDSSRRDSEMILHFFELLATKQQKLWTLMHRLKLCFDSITQVSLRFYLQHQDWNIWKWFYSFSYLFRCICRDRAGITMLKNCSPVWVSGLHLEYLIRGRNMLNHMCMNINTYTIHKNHPDLKLQLLDIMLYSPSRK